jgi:hypothetical protein
VNDSNLVEGRQARDDWLLDLLLLALFARPLTT